jgi:hypothetical protein
LRWLRGLHTLGLWHTVVRPLLIRLRAPVGCGESEGPAGNALVDSDFAEPVRLSEWSLADRIKISKISF